MLFRSAAGAVAGLAARHAVRGVGATPAKLTAAVTEAGALTGCGSVECAADTVWGNCDAGGLWGVSLRGGCRGRGYLLEKLGGWLM